MQAPDARYRRTPLPPDARLKVGWILLCLAGLFACPFIGFAIHGKVEEPGLAIGLVLAVVPLAGLALLATKHWAAMRRLPPELAEEWRKGRFISAAGAPIVDTPARFSHQNDSIEIQPEGMVVSRSTLLGLRGVENSTEKMWIAQTVGDYFMPWSDLSEWEVHTDSDGPNFYRLNLRTKGHVLIRRFRPVEGCEADLLDAVRHVGKLPIRLLCDLDDL
ncbi:MAG: hypothetical protein AB1443_10295 [Pseudomonadota bacterium]